MWHVPGRDDLVGIFRADGLAGWHYLERELPGGRRAGSGARLRRADSRAEVVVLYEREALRNNAPVPGAVYRVPP